MRSKSDYALLWANGKSFGEVFTLMLTDILGPNAFADGESVYYDESRGVVRDCFPSTRPESDDYLVEWENGEVTTEWGSDLEREL